MIITVSGEIGAGKSTVGRTLARSLELRYLSTGEIYRDEAKRRGVSLVELGRLAAQDLTIDRMLDAKQVEAARGGDILVDSRLSGWLIDGDLRIWLRAPLEVRAARVAAREHTDRETAASDVRAREAGEHRRFLDTYHLDLSDLTRYHVIVDTAKWPANEIVAALVVLARALRAAPGGDPAPQPGGTVARGRSS